MLSSYCAGCQIQTTSILTESSVGQCSSRQLSCVCSAKRSQHSKGSNHLGSGAWNLRSAPYCCVTLNKWVNLSEPVFPSVKYYLKPVPPSCRVRKIKWGNAGNYRPQDAAANTGVCTDASFQAQQVYPFPHGATERQVTAKMWSLETKEKTLSQLGKSDKGVLTSGDLRAVGCGRGNKAETGTGTRAPPPADGSESLPGLLFHVQRVQEGTQCAHTLSRFSRVWLFATHGLQPARLLCPRDSPGKKTGVGCHFLLQLIGMYLSLFY